MKKILGIIIFFASVSFLFSGEAEAGSCLKFNGSVNASNFPSGASVKVSCLGDNPPGEAGCVGSSKTVKPGQSFTLDNCSCLADECMHVELVNAPSCTTDAHRKYCGTNANTSISAPINVSCPAPTPSTPPGVCTPGDEQTNPTCRVCDPNGQWQKDYSVGDWLECKCKDDPDAPECQPTPTPPSGVCTPGDTRTDPKCEKCDPNGNWSKDYSVGDWQECFCKDNPNDPSCQTGSPPPTSTPPASTPPVGGQPTPTTPPGGPGPRCNANCTGNPNICTQATDGCTVCTVGPGGGSTCQPPLGQPSVTPPGGGGPTATPPPAPTPTPDFNTSMCKCDGFENSPILAGQNATFRAFGKVEGDDVSKAKISNISFLFAETAKGATTGKSIASSGKLAAEIIEQSPNKVRYTSEWTTQIPADVDPNKSYRVFAELDCQRNTQASAGTQAVLAAEDENVSPSLFGRIINFFQGLFGTPSPEDTQDQESSEEDATILQEQIRLGTIKPANVTLKSCSALYFEFPGVQE